MGESKRRGSKEDRIAQAQARTKTEAQIPISSLDIFQIQEHTNRLFSSLTTPSEINAQVSEFTQTLSTSAPIFLECMPEQWSRQSCCDANVTQYVELNGGEMLCGYRIWYNEPLYIEGERHAVWIKDGEIRDVSFVDSGESKTLFVPDDKEFEGAPAKIRYAFDELDKTVITQFDAMEKLIPTRKLSAQEAWNLMPTYQDWLAGVRMPNTIPVLRPK